MLIKTYLVPLRAIINHEEHPRTRKDDRTNKRSSQQQLAQQLTTPTAPRHRNPLSI